MGGSVCPGSQPVDSSPVPRDGGSVCSGAAQAEGLSPAAPSEAHSASPSGLATSSGAISTVPHERPGVEPCRAVGVEDSAPGLAAARAAGLVVASVGGARPADIVCEDLRQLLRLLAVSRG